MSAGFVFSLNGAAHHGLHRFLKTSLCGAANGVFIAKTGIQGKPGKQQFERMRPIIRLLEMNALMRL